MREEVYDDGFRTGFFRVLLWQRGVGSRSGCSL